MTFNDRYFDPPDDEDEPDLERDPYDYYPDEFDDDDDFDDEMICDSCGFAWAESQLCPDCGLCPDCCECGGLAMIKVPDVFGL